MVKSPLIESKNKFGVQKFIQEAVSELKKVVWPTKDQVIKMTLIVIGVSLVAGLFIGGLDYLFTKLIGFIIT